MTLKCLDKVTGQNKCPDKKNPTKIYCHTQTGKCYTATKAGKPHGLKKYLKEDETIIYNQEYKLFGKPQEVDQHIMVFSQSPEEKFTLPNLSLKTLDQLKKLALEIDPNWDTHTYKSKNVLLSEIMRKSKKKTTETSKQILEKKMNFDYDEFDKYDIWTNELSKKSTTLLEYIPFQLETQEKSLIEEIKTIWK